MFNFEPEFRYSRMVLLSMGVNDMSTSKDGRKPPMTGRSLADWLTGSLRKCCAKNSSTTFMFTSVLHTHHHWLNSEIDVFNRAMSELSRSIPNMELFDSHAVLLRNNISRHVDQVLDKSDPRGTHLTLAAKRLISSQLVTACEVLDGRQKGYQTGHNMSSRGWTWPRARRAVYYPNSRD